jgi:hypothetical protein
MFVQCAKFVDRHNKSATRELSVYGVEQKEGTVPLAKMNLALHGLSGDIRLANSYYEDPHSSVGSFDFVMANPPFNVDKVDKTKVAGDPRFGLGIPKSDNGNYLWIQQFYAALSDRGRAGFVIANSAGDAGHSEREIREKLIKSGAVDVMVAIGTNFFYTVTLPVTLWFLDNGKRGTEREDTVLFLDVRHQYRQIDRAHRDFLPEQLELLANVVRLYRGEEIETIDGSDTLMKERFPDGMYVDVPGLCKVATRAEIEAQRWSLNPGRYTGTASADVTARTSTRRWPPCTTSSSASAIRLIIFACASKLPCRACFQMTEWRDVSLCELGTVERGKSRHRPRNDPSLYGGDVPFFQTGDVKAATLHMNDASQWYSTKGVAQSRIWAAGIACITIEANISETAVLGCSGCFPDSVLGFTPTHQKADAYFVKYLLDVHRGALTSAARGTAQDNLSLEKLLAYRFPVPEAPARALIASALRSFDDLIENNRQRVDVLEEMARSVYREWFVRFRYPGYENVELVDSAVGPIPSGWTVAPLKDVADIVMGQSPSSEFYNDEGIGKPFHQGVSDFGSHFPTTRKWCSANGRAGSLGNQGEGRSGLLRGFSPQKSAESSGEVADRVRSAAGPGAILGRRP